MSNRSAIQWTQFTWNPIVGCSVHSPGCANCYAMPMAARLERMLPPQRHGTTILPNHYTALTRPSKAGPVWTGRISMAPQSVLLAPLMRKKPTIYFVNSMGDLFHESIPDAWIDRVFAVMALTPHHTYQALTKRSDRMRQYLSSITTDDHRGRMLEACDAVAEDFEPGSSRSGQRFWGNWYSDCKGDQPLPNVWLGVSAEDQRRADQRIPDLLDTPAAVRFVSAEPLLGPIRFDKIGEWADTFEDCGGHPDPAWPRDTHDWTWLDALRGHFDSEARSPTGKPLGSIDVGLAHKGGKLDWIIVGGESGDAARPMHPDWAKQIRDQCAAAGVPFFFKQWGSYAPLQRSADVIDAGGAQVNVAWPDGSIGPGAASARGGPGQSLYRGTKSVTGRLLDGVEHNAMPEVAHVG